MDLSNLNIFGIDEDIKEKEFPDYIKKQGFNCLKANYKFISEIQKALLQLNRTYDIFIQDLGKGCPDFFIYNNSDCYLVEFKSKGDTISNIQLEWVLEHQNLPYVLFFVKSIVKDKQLQSSDKGEKDIKV